MKRLPCLHLVLIILVSSLLMAQGYIGPKGYIGAKGYLGGSAGGGGGITLGTGAALACTLNATGCAGPTGFTVTPYSGSFTVTAGTHPALFIGCGSEGANVTGITYNSVSLTQLWPSKADGASIGRSSGYLMINPPTGASDTLTITSSGAPSGGQCFAQVFYGVNQTGTVGNSWRTVPSATSDAGGCTGPATVTVSAAVSGDVVIDTVTEYNISVLTPGAGQTGQYNTGTSWDDFYMGVSTITATGSTTPTWTFGAGVNCWAYDAVALIPG